MTAPAHVQPSKPLSFPSRTLILSKEVGNFIDGEKIGKGEYTFANGDRYIGEFQGNKMHGEGIYIYATGRVYTGIFKEGNLLIKKSTTPNKSGREDQ